MEIDDMNTNKDEQSEETKEQDMDRDEMKEEIDVVEDENKLEYKMKSLESYISIVIV